MWYRYIDDIFCIWQYGEDKLERFTSHLNSAHSTIKFTIEKSRTPVNFLDTTVSLGNNRLETSLYVKLTDRENYLPFDSAHLYHCKKGLPYSQFLRIRRICSKFQDFKHNCTVKAAQLRQKGYPQTLIQESYAKARHRSQDELLTYREKNTTEAEQKIYMTTKYNPAYDGLRAQVLKIWNLLNWSSSTRQIHSLGLQVGYRRQKSLRDLPVRSKLPSTSTNPCCRYCPKLNTDGHIKVSVTGKKYRRRHNVSCNSNNLVYCITCTRCGKQYVGQTKNSLKQRFQGHFYQIAHDAD